MIDTAPNDQVSDILRKIPNGTCHDKRDVHVTFERGVLRRSDEVKPCGISDGSSVQVTSKIRGGGKHEEKKSKPEKKQVAGQESVSGVGAASSEREKDSVIQLVENDDAHRQVVAYLQKETTEQKMQCWTSTFRSGRMNI